MFDDPFFDFKSSLSAVLCEDCAPVDMRAELIRARTRAQACLSLKQYIRAVDEAHSLAVALKRSLKNNLTSPIIGI